MTNLKSPIDMAVETAPIDVILQEYSEEKQTRYHDSNSIKLMAGTKKLTGTNGGKDTDDGGTD